MKASKIRCLVRGAILAGAFLVQCAAFGQQWENLHGGVACNESAHNGVHRVTEGGYVAAGHTFSSVAGCASSDVYVVRTDNHGGLAWSRSYNLGIHDSATDIEEVPNSSGGTDGFIITGVTDHGLTGDPCAISRDLFLLRIDRCGNVVWQRTYGTAATDEIGWDVIRATKGNGVTTRAGDYVVAGMTVSGADSNGYLLRVTSAGAIIWGRSYQGPLSGDDYFFSLDELTNSAVSGDIIAAGGTTSYTPTHDAWLLRVNGNTGAVTASAAYWRTSTDESFRSVQELVTGTNAGHIVAVGQTRGIFGAMNQEVYLLEVTNGLVYVNDLTLGDNVSAADEGFCVREIPVTVAVPSGLIVTGYLTPPGALGHGAQDAFLQEFTSGTLARVGNAFVYGSDYNDRGWSVECVLSSGSCIVRGFVVSGFSQFHEDAPMDPLQLYLFKTNWGKQTGCQKDYAPVAVKPNLPRDPDLPIASVFENTCTPVIIKSTQTWAQNVCTIVPDGTVLCSIPLCPAAKSNPESGGAEDGVEMNGVKIGAYPNPIRRGTPLTLECTLLRSDRISIAVSDINGAIILRDERDLHAGANALPLSTEGWPSGAYTIQMTIGDASYTRRVVVVDR